MKKIPLIIDCDPGIDDAIAILFALKDEMLDILGITVVAGNHVLEKTLNNTLKLLSFLKTTNIPVAAGFDEPIVGKLQTAEQIHGKNTIAEFDFGKSILKKSDLHAIDLMADLIKKSHQKVTIAALGPLTNIAFFIKRYPDLTKNIEKICFMGGSASKGNKTMFAEFNVFTDPEATDIVLGSNVNITMIGLDVTRKAKLYKDEILQIKNINNNISNMIVKLIEFYMKFYEKNFEEGCILHDAVVIAYLIDNLIVESKKAHVCIDRYGKYSRGMTVVDFDGYLQKDKNIEVCLDIDREKFVDMLIKNIKKYNIF